MAAVGLVFEIIGAVLLGLDLMNVPQALPSPDELRVLLPDLVRALRERNDESLTRVGERVSAWALAQTAEEARSSSHRLGLRRTGQIGLGLIVLGSVLHYRRERARVAEIGTGPDLS
jgi:hypothetical protein